MRVARGGRNELSGGGKKELLDRDILEWTGKGIGFGVV